MKIIEEINELLEQKEQRLRNQERKNQQGEGKDKTPNRKGPVMSHVDMKPPDHEREDVDLRSSEEDSYKTVELAEQLIRALDAESDEHMQQISAEDKLSNS